MSLGPLGGGLFLVADVPGAEGCDGLARKTEATLRAKVSVASGSQMPLAVTARLQV